MGAHTLREPFLVMAVARSEVRIRQHDGSATSRTLPVPSAYAPDPREVELLASEHP